MGFRTGGCELCRVLERRTSAIEVAMLKRGHALAIAFFGLSRNRLLLREREREENHTNETKKQSKPDRSFTLGSRRFCCISVHKLVG